MQESFLQLEKAAKAEKEKEVLTKQAKASAQEVSGQYAKFTVGIRTERMMSEEL